MGSFLAFMGGLAVAFLLACYNGLMLSTFWEWFVMSQFKGVPPIGIAAACGLSLLVSSVTHQSTKDEKSFGESLLSSFAKITVLFGCGWIIHLFV